MVETFPESVSIDGDCDWGAIQAFVGTNHYDLTGQVGNKMTMSIIARSRPQTSKNAANA